MPAITAAVSTTRATSSERLIEQVSDALRVIYLTQSIMMFFVSNRPPGLFLRFPSFSQGRAAEPRK